MGLKRLAYFAYTENSLRRRAKHRHNGIMGGARRIVIALPVVVGA
jgi:hypothetical protein